MPVATRLYPRGSSAAREISTQYAEERLRWKPRHPLLVMAVRAYRLQTPIEVPNSPALGGCKSWLTLDEDVSPVDLTAAIDDATYAARIAEVREALTRVPAGTA